VPEGIVSPLYFIPLGMESVETTTADNAASLLSSVTSRPGPR